MSFGNFRAGAGSTPFGAQATTGFGNFGATTTSTPAPSFGLGSTITTPANTGFQFGASPAFSAQPKPFGSPQPLQTTFGTNPLSAPAFGVNPTPAPAFGSNLAQAPAFGANPTATSSFGVNAAAPSAFGVNPSPVSAFGTNPTAAPAFGVSSTVTPAFGINPAPTPSFGATSSGGGFGFGTQSATTSGFQLGGTTQASGLTFGAAAAPATISTFGTPATSTGFSLGAPASTAGSGLTFGNLTTPTFGTPTTQATTFGTAANTALSFGSPATTSAGILSTNQGTPSATTNSQTFGTTPGLSFGSSPATTSATGLTFGTNISTPATVLKFGATSAPTTGFAFGAPPATTTTASSLNFAATPAAVPASSLSFGATPGTTQTAGVTAGAATTTTATGTGLALGSPAVGATSTGLTFGVASTTQSTSSVPSFGLSTITSTAPGLTFGNLTPATTPGSLNSGTKTTSTPVSSGLNFGATPTNLGAAATTTSSLLGTPSTSTPSFGLPSTTVAGISFGGAPTTSSGLTLGLVGKTLATTTTTTIGLTTSTTTSGFSLGAGGSGLFGASTTTPASLSTSTTTTAVGLGGVDTSQSKLGLAGQGAGEPKQLRDHPLPDAILHTFNDFTNFVKQQKSVSVDIAHLSAKPLKKVQEDIDANEALLANITSGLARSSVATEKLKNETAQGLFHADMAQRLRENPGSFPHESGPDQFFSDLVMRFETDAERLQLQVDTAERHLRSITQSSVVSPQELTLAARRLHETLVALAARTQSLHISVQSAQEEYRHLRQVYLKEDLPPKPAMVGRRSTQRSLAGPTPFSETSGVANLTVDALSMLTGATVTPPTNNSSWLGAQQTGTSLLTSPNSSFLAVQPVDNSFQLSKPPVGNKRNKR